MNDMKQIAYDAVKAASEAPYVSPGRGYGCGRAYVSIDADKATINAIAAACSRLGLIFQRKAHYGLRNAIYIGYDNADGRAIAKSQAFAAELNKRGIKAYDSAESD